MPGTTVVLVRHAQSRWNAAGLLQGQHGPGLSARGRAQAAATAAALAHRHPAVSAIVRSDLPRVAETAAPTERALGLMATPDPRLRELDLGSWTGLRHDDVRAVQAEDFARWLGGADVDSHGGETFSDLQARMTAVLDDLAAAHTGDSVLVFSHGGPIRIAAATALGLPAGGIDRLEPPGNCSLTVLTWHPGGAGARIVTYNQRPCEDCASEDCPFY